MKKYVVLKACGISGSFYQPGDTVELDSDEAGGLLACHQVAEHSVHLNQLIDQKRNLL